MLSLIVSTVAYFIASHYIKRSLDRIGAPPGFTRSALIFCAAVLIAYGVAFIVDWAGDFHSKHAAVYRFSFAATGAPGRA